jgi:hypothetical protein
MSATYIFSTATDVLMRTMSSLAEAQVCMSSMSETVVHTFLIPCVMTRSCLPHQVSRILPSSSIFPILVCAFLRISPGRPAGRAIWILWPRRWSYGRPRGLLNRLLRGRGLGRGLKMCRMRNCWPLGTTREIWRRCTLLPPSPLFES